MVACSHPDDEAQALVAAAAKQTSNGQRLEETSFREAKESYEGALETLGQIQTRFPDTPTAHQIVAGEIQVGPFTAQQLGLRRALIIALADAESGVLPCGAYLAERVVPPLPRARALAAVARRAHGQGERELAERLLARCLATARGLPPGSPGQQAAFAELVGAYLATHQFDLAHAAILEAGLADEWHDLAGGLAADGQSERARAMIATTVAGSPLARAGALTAIASAAVEEGHPERARPLMAEAEGWVARLDPLGRRTAGLFMARHYARQGNDAQAETWLAVTDGLHYAPLPALEALLGAYQARHQEARLLAVVHRDLAVIMAGTALPVRQEALWLANEATLQARLGELEPGLFGLARARLLLERPRPAASARSNVANALQDWLMATTETDALLGLAERLVTLKQLDQARVLALRAIERMERSPKGLAVGVRRDELLGRCARTLAVVDARERALSTIAAIDSPAVAAIALADLAIARPDANTIQAADSPVALHALLRRFGNDIQR